MNKEVVTDREKTDYDSHSGRSPDVPDGYQKRAHDTARFAGRRRSEKTM